VHAPRRALAALAMLALAAACSKHDEAKSQNDLSKSAKDAANSARAELKKIAHDPDLKRAAADLKAFGHDAARDLRKRAAEAGGATNAVVNGAQHAGPRQDPAEKSRSDNDAS
jgi:hypothetical protein